MMERGQRVETKQETEWKVYCDFFCLYQWLAETLDKIFLNY